MVRMMTVLIALTAAGLVSAKDTGQWSNVQGLRKGDRIGVIQADQKRVEGRFDSATESRITLQADRPISLEKGDVVRVYRRARRGHVFGAILGGAIGTAL